MSNLHQAQSHEVLRSWQSQRNDINHHKDFVLPMFIGNDDDSIEPIETMPEVYRYGCNRAIEYLEPLVYSFGLRAVLLFPVVTKIDQERLDAKLNVGVEVQDDDDEDEIVSSTNSSGTPPTPSSSSSSDDEETGRASDLLGAERLLSVEESSSQIQTTQSQNPFLNQNEEEEDHLLGEQIDQADRSAVLSSIPAKKIVPTKDASLMLASKSLDVKLIRGLALKDTHNPVLRLVPKLRAKFPELLIICDVCLCAFTSTGHCCLFEDNPMGGHNVLTSNDFSDRRHHHVSSRSPAVGSNMLNTFPISNKVTCQYLAMLSVEYALRGCNVVAPSDMMDGRILRIREKLDENRLQHVSILSYSAKFASSFYGPFRQATNNAPEFGDRRAYQLPPGSRAMAMKSVKRDIAQGADFVMVKPGGPYLDIVRDIRQAVPDVPIAVYQVSGEYAMLKVAAKANILDLKAAVNEMLTSYRRAGANIIITYFAPELLRGEL